MKTNTVFFEVIISFIYNDNNNISFDWRQFIVDSCDGGI